MTKNDFVEQVQKIGEFSTKVEAQKAVNAVTKAIQEAVADKKKVTLVGFGTFEAVFQKGREGKVPGTDKSYVTEDKYVPKFKAGKAFKEAVAKK